MQAKIEVKLIQERVGAPDIMLHIELKQLVHRWSFQIKSEKNLMDFNKKL